MFLAEVDYPGWIAFRQADRKVVNRLRHAQGSIERRSTPCPRINRTAVQDQSNGGPRDGPLSEQGWTVPYSLRSRSKDQCLLASARPGCGTCESDNEGAAATMNRLRKEESYVEKELYSMTKIITKMTMAARTEAAGARIDGCLFMKSSRRHYTTQAF